MSDLPPHLQSLNDCLMALEVMPVSVLNGLISGVVVCPDLLAPSAWMPEVFKTFRGEPVGFENAQKAQAMYEEVMRYYNSVVQDLHDGRYEPVFDIDTATGDILWEGWAHGFSLAMDLAPAETWTGLLEGADEDVADAMAMIVSLIAIAMGESPLKKKRIRELDEMAPEAIPLCVDALHRGRLRAYAFGAAQAPERKGTKTGRNDPCPCGSGKKYKKCCGLN